MICQAVFVTVSSQTMDQITHLSPPRSLCSSRPSPLQMVLHPCPPTPNPHLQLLHLNLLSHSTTWDPASANMPSTPPTPSRSGRTGRTGTAPARFRVSTRHTRTTLRILMAVRRALRLGMIVSFPAGRMVMARGGLMAGPCDLSKAGHSGLSRCGYCRTFYRVHRMFS